MNKVLQKYNPSINANHKILKYYSETLNEEDLLDFIFESSKLNGWIIASEIANSSTNKKILQKTILIFNQMMNVWVDDRIIHEKNNESYSVKPYIPKSLKLDFARIITTIRNLDYPDSSLIILDRFILNSHHKFLSQYLDFCLKIFIEYSTIREIELFYIKLIKNKEINSNYRVFITKYLTSLGNSSHLFSCTEPFINLLKESKSLFSLKPDPTSITISSYIDLIINKKIDLSDPHNSRTIDEYFEKNAYFRLNNLSFLSFLKRFNYQFNEDLIISQLNQFFQLISNQFSSFQENSGPKKVKIFNYFVHKSEIIVEYFIFYLSELSQNKTSLYIEKFLQFIDEIRIKFNDFPFFIEFDNFIPLEGDLLRKKKNDVKINILKDLEDRFLNCQHKWDVQLNINDYKLAYFTPGHSKSNNKDNNLIRFAITRLSPLNKGRKINVKTYPNYFEDTIKKFNLKHLFLSFELSLIKLISNSNNFPYPFENIYKVTDFHPSINYTEKISIPIIEIEELIKKYRSSYYKLIVLDWNSIISSYEKIKELFKQNKYVFGEILSSVNGGFKVKIENITAFLPGSHADIINISKPGEYIDKKCYFKIIKTNDLTRNVIVSRIEILNIEFKKLISKLKVGMILKGTVCGIEEYGAFINTGGIVGLLHIKELSYFNVTNINSTLSINQDLEVVIVNIDIDNSKIWFGLKQISEPKEFQIEQEYSSGKNIQINDLSFDHKRRQFLKHVEFGYKIIIHEKQVNWQRFNMNHFPKKYLHLYGKYIVSYIYHEAKLIFVESIFEDNYNDKSYLKSLPSITATYIGSNNNTGYFNYKGIVITCPSKYMPQKTIRSQLSKCNLKLISTAKNRFYCKFIDRHS